MKILVIAKGRCGSHSLIDWLGEEFDLKTIYENEDKDISVVDDYIIKRHPSTDYIIEEYDYVIRLIRENTILTSESRMWAEDKKKYHPKGKEKYIIDEDFLIKNHIEIWNGKITYDQSNNQIRNIDVGILVTYEELFLHGTGQEKIEKYMSFKSTTKLDTDLKKARFHVMDKTVYTTYDLAFNKKINNIIQGYEGVSKEKELIINNLNEKIINLNETINSLNQTIVDLVSSKRTAGET
jgi:hypothetical protein